MKKYKKRYNELGGGSFLTSYIHWAIHLSSLLFCWCRTCSMLFMLLILLLSLLIIINNSSSKKVTTFAVQYTMWPCGLMDKASDFGSEDCRFESCHGR